MRSLRPVFLAAAAALLLIAPAARADGPAPRAASCPLLAAADEAALLGAPPAPGSDQARADTAILLWEQERRQPEDLARAAGELHLTLSAWATTLAPGFDVATHPATQALLERASRDVAPCLDALKRRFGRTRPFLADSRLVPPLGREESPSFPSGHATRGALFAALLAELAPERAEALRARGRLVGLDRVVIGLHYPSDVAAGQRLGAALAVALLADPGFRLALQEVRAREWRARQGDPTQGEMPVKGPGW